MRLQSLAFVGFSPVMFFALFSLSLLLLVSCGPSQGGVRDRNYHTGSEGVVMSFTDGYPERETYENYPLPISIELQNRGATDVPFERMMLSFSYDPLYIDGGSDGGENSKNYDFSANGYEGYFFGRSEYYPNGDEAIIDLFNFMTKKVVGLREAPKTQFSALLCYEYMTYYASEVCIDVDKFLRTGREQACVGQDLSASSQGAPVAITHVEVRNSPINTGGAARFSRPEFVVTLRNVGQGLIVAPPQQDFLAACRLEGLSSQELNAVLVNGTIFNIPLECKPALVRMSQGEGKTYCTIPESQLDNPALFVQQNVMTVLQLNAFYVYRQPIFHELIINRNPLGDDETYVGDLGYKAKGYAYDGSGKLLRDDRGDPLTLCKQAASSGGSVGGASLNANWSCGCNRDSCLKMDQDGFCVYGLCPGNLECCDSLGFTGVKK